MKLKRFWLDVVPNSGICHIYYLLIASQLSVD